jgi:S1-C subfamily serine protease
MALSCILFILAGCNKSACQNGHCAIVPTMPVAFQQSIDHILEPVTHERINAYRLRAFIVVGDYTETSWGTAAAIQPRTLVTVAHVVSGRGVTIQAEFNGQWVKCHIAAIDNISDLAILISDSDAPLTSPIQPVQSLSMSGSRESAAIRSAHANLLKFEFVADNMGAGCSGAPIFNPRGEIIAIVTAHMADERHGIAVAGQALQDIVNREFPRAEIVELP